MRPVPTGTVLFITSARPSAEPISSTAWFTAERSASPECVGGVCTQTKTSRAASSSSPISVVKVSRSEFLAISSASSGSWNGQLAGFQRGDLLGQDVAGHDAVAHLGEAGGRHQADPADADDADWLSFAHPR